MPEYYETKIKGHLDRRWADWFAGLNLDHMEGLNMDQIMAAVKNGGEGKLVDVEDEEKGEYVEIFVE